MQPDAVCAMWTAGDYATFGDLFASVGRDLVDDVGVAGLDVLDVATGTGNTAIAAAERGGRVTAMDITPKLLAVARERAAGRGVDVNWFQGDMCKLDVPDHSFDRVLSTFGAMVAPQPAAMATELLRVCRPGGVVASTAWSAEAGMSRMGDVLVPFFPRPDNGGAPPGPPPHNPSDWARPQRVTEFFAGLQATVTHEERSVTIRWASVDEATTMLTTSCGPLVGAVAALRAADRWLQARAALVDMLASLNHADDGSLAIDMPYVVTIAQPM
jgi:SAM-dependent methyltransferase